MSLTVALDLKVEIMNTNFIFQLTKKMEELNDKTVCSDTDLRADMERWHKNKQKDLKELFMSQCDRQITYYEKVSSNI